MLPIATTFLHARRWPLWIIYLLICAPWIVLLIFFEPDDKTSIYVYIALFTHLLFAFFYYAVIKMEIGIYNEGLVYKNIIKTKEVLWDEIVSSELSYDFDMHGGRVKWIFQTREKKLAIEPTYFSRHDNRLLAETLISKAKRATVSENIVMMAHGRFPWYIR